MDVGIDCDLVAMETAIYSTITPLNVILLDHI